MPDLHNGPTGLNRVASGTTGTLVAVVLLWFVIDEHRLISEPPQLVRDGMVGLIVAAYGGAWSAWLGEFFERLGAWILSKLPRASE
jgi:hypothetical protein